MGSFDLLKLIIAIIPIIWLLVSIGKLNIPSHIASGIALLISLFSAWIIFKMPLIDLFQASAEGVMLAWHPILLVIISALFVYNITVSTGSMEKIKNMLVSISPDRRIQTLILAFGFGGFLEAVAGFGTAVAIPAGIMAAMGFNPLTAAIVCLVANTVPVAFGVLGVPIITLAQVTSLPVTALSVNTALQLLPLILLLPLVLIAILTGSVRKTYGVIGVSIVSSMAFALGQLLVTLYIGPETAAAVGSLLALAVIVVWARIRPVKKIWRFDDDQDTPTQANPIGTRQALIAWSPYLLILILVFSVRAIPFLKFLFEYPFTLTRQFYFGPGGKPQTFQLAVGAGTILFVSAIAGGLIQGAKVKSIFLVLLKTLYQLRKTILTVMAIVIVAKIMGYSGMVGSIASFIAVVSGSFYPFIAPLIGAIGTFITGSDTSSNVLFGNLQKQTALQLGMNPEWLTAANASGATAGKMISPQSISIATASVGLEGKESTILKVTIKYCVAYVVLLGIIVFVFR